MKKLVVFTGAKELANSSLEQSMTLPNFRSKHVLTACDRDAP